MSSPHVKEKLPLWVGGDLPELEMQSIQTHLDACHACRAEARAYRESLSWLKGALDTSFTQAERLDIRNEVMADICKHNKPGNKRALPWLLAAASIPAALLLYYGTGRPFSQAALSGVKSDKTVADQIAVQSPPATIETLEAKQPQPLPGRTAPKALKRQPHTHQAKSLPDQQGQMEPRPSVMRIEFQTDNPNIKIIWFARTDSIS